MRDNYKEIEIKRTTFQEDTKTKAQEDDVIEVNVDDLIGDDEDDKQPVVQQTDEVAKKQEDKPAKPRESRAEKRIRQLHAEREDALRQLAEERKSREILERQVLQSTKGSKEDHKKSLELSIGSTKKLMAEAVRDGDADKVVDLQDLLMNMRMELAGLDAEIKQTTAVLEREPVTKPVTDSRPQIPEKALEWIEEHDAFRTDPVFNAASIAVNNQLLREGYNVESDKFYQELNKRLAPRFPEVFGNTSENAVELDEDNDSSEEAVATDVKPKAKPAKLATQTVSGSSRPSGTGVVQPKKLASAQLTEADIRQSERWGISLDRLAKRKAFIDKHKDNAGGYVPIMIDRN